MQRPSRVVMIRMTPDLHQRTRALALLSHRTLSNLVKHLIECELQRTSDFAIRPPERHNQPPADRSPDEGDFVTRAFYEVSSATTAPTGREATAVDTSG